MINILVTGSNGQLGSEIRELSVNFNGYDFFFTDVKDLDITNHNDISSFVQAKKVNVIINCAAYTAVDKAEFDTQVADSVNNKAVANLAQICKDFNIKLVHISTDYVFDGKKSVPYIESDKTNPKSIYGKTKRNGELAIFEINPVNSIIIRTSWVYSKYGKNFVKTMLALAKQNKRIDVVSDQFGNPTNAADLAKVILEILPRINNFKPQVFHFSNEGKCSWFEFAKSIFEIKKIEANLHPIKTYELNLTAPRPKNSLLDKSLIKKTYGITTYNWFESLENFLNRK